MLTGEYNHSIDSKGRLIIPAKFREILGDSFVITKGLDNCLFVYPDNEWKLFEEKLRTLPLTNKNARTFTRFFLGSAVEGVLDKQGRVLISSALRDFAGLEKEVVLVGVLDRVCLLYTSSEAYCIRGSRPAHWHRKDECQEKV